MTVVLAVDDDAAILRTLGIAMRARGYEVETVADGRSALQSLTERVPDVVLLDLGLPDLDGTEVLRRIRETSQVPVVVLSARHESDDKVEALDLGADDYVTKPFSPRELVLRIRKLLARAKASEEPVAHLRFGDLEIDVARHAVSVNGKPVELTATEFRLLEILARRRGRVQTRDRLLQDVWGYENPIDSRTVDTHMRRLWEKIGAAADYLETIRGVGYRFRAEE